MSPLDKEIRRYRDKLVKRYKKDDEIREYCSHKKTGAINMISSNPCISDSTSFFDMLVQANELNRNFGKDQKLKKQKKNKDYMFKVDNIFKINYNRIAKETMQDNPKNTGFIVVNNHVARIFFRTGLSSDLIRMIDDNFTFECLYKKNIGFDIDEVKYYYRTIKIEKKYIHEALEQIKVLKEKEEYKKYIKEIIGIKKIKVINI